MRAPVVLLWMFTRGQATRASWTSSPLKLAILDYLQTSVQYVIICSELVHLEIMCTSWLWFACVLKVDTSASSLDDEAQMLRPALSFMPSEAASPLKDNDAKATSASMCRTETVDQVEHKFMCSNHWISRGVRFSISCTSFYVIHTLRSFLWFKCLHRIRFE